MEMVRFRDNTEKRSREYVVRGVISRYKGQRVGLVSDKKQKIKVEQILVR